VNAGDLGEFGLIDRIAGQVKPGVAVEVGIGDDAAVISPTAGTLTLTTTDMLVEGVHFDLSLCDPTTLGRKSLSVNLSDIAAMGGVPRHFLLSMALPSSTTVEFIDEFVRGTLSIAEHFGVSLIGGDTCSSRGGVVISITVLGEQVPGKVVRRRGAAAGDIVFVTGALGDSALGLQMLKRGERGGRATDRHLDPSPRVREGAALAEAGIPTAMIDVSDGLLADLGHILEQSAVGARLDLDKIPLSSFFIEKCRPLCNESMSLALAGGEDYELLFTAPASRNREIFSLMQRLGTPVTAIGEITAEERLRVITEDGGEYRITKLGFNHFA
jgi:thiamine-monophosphate kinase